MSVNIRNVNNIEHMEIVNTSAEGASASLLLPFTSLLQLVEDYARI